MKLSISSLNGMLHTTLAGTLIGVVAMTLIALPMGVFAQSETVGTTTEDNTSVSSELIQQDELDTVAVPQAQTLTDTYKREKLPDSNIEFNDFVVGPGYLSMEVAPGESKTVSLSISNRLGERKLFQLTTEDMTSDSDTGGMRFMGDEVGPYTLKDYISVPYESFYLENNQRAIVPVTITIPPDAEPGGFYGSILTQIVSESNADGASDVAPSAPLVSRIGTLFFVTTPGEIERSGTFLDFTTIPVKSLYMSGPIDMGVVFENTGSVHFNPYGNVVVKNIIGDTVGEVELDPWFVMPDSLRTKELSWNREFLIGRYTVTADMNLGYEDTFESKTLVFWVFPWKFLAVVFSGVFIFFLVVRFAVTNFEFKRK